MAAPHNTTREAREVVRMSIPIRATVVIPSGVNSAYGSRPIPSAGGGTRASAIVGSGVSLFYGITQLIQRVVTRDRAMDLIRPVEDEVRRRIEAGSRAGICRFVVVLYTTRENRFADPMGNRFAQLTGADFIGEGPFPQQIVDQAERRGYIYPGGNIVFTRHYVAYSAASVMMTG